MESIDDFRCRCSRCVSDGICDPVHQFMRVLMSQLSDPQRRLLSALEATRIGFGGSKLVSEITGISTAPIARGRAELKTLAEGRKLAISGRPGRRSIEKMYPEIRAVLEQLILDDTGGDPMSRNKWVRLSCRKLSQQLAALGFQVSYHTVWHLLKLMGYSMKVGIKTRAATRHSPERDQQFKYISEQKAAFLAAGDPVISVDAKKKELIGNFKPAGRVWCKKSVGVTEYKYASKAQCVATPYGIYDVGLNKGYVWVGTSGDTPAFAVIPRLRMNEDIRSSVIDLVRAGKREPLAHELFQEAWKQRNELPRSSLMIGITAAEVGFKMFVADLVPHAEWLAMHAPAPPLIEMLTEYLPRLPLRNLIKDYAIFVPKEILDSLKKGVRLRNKTAHAGEKVNSDTLKEILLAVRDLFYLLDIYAGHAWALELISHKTLELMKAGIEAQKGDQPDECPADGSV